MSYLRPILAAIVAFVVLAILPAVALACPTCKDQLASDANNAGLVSGFFWSILFMLSMPLLLAGSGVAYLISQISEAESLAEKNLPFQASTANVVADAEAHESPVA